MRSDMAKLLKKGSRIRCRLSEPKGYKRAQSRILDAQLAEERAKLQFLENYAELKAVVGE